MRSRPEDGARSVATTTDRDLASADPVFRLLPPPGLTPDAILQPPLPPIPPATRVLQRAADPSADREAAS